jgi:hypothetical protein
MEINIMKFLILSFLLTLSAFAASPEDYLAINKKASKLFVAQNNFSFDSADKEIIQKVSKARWDLLKQAKDQNAEAKKLFLDFIKTTKAAKAAPDDKKLKMQVIISRNKIDAFLATNADSQNQFKELYTPYSEAMNSLDQVKASLFTNEQDKSLYLEHVEKLKNIRNQNDSQDI